MTEPNDAPPPHERTVLERRQEEVIADFRRAMAHMAAMQAAPSDALREQIVRDFKLAMNNLVELIGEQTAAVIAPHQSDAIMLRLEVDQLRRDVDQMMQHIAIILDTLRQQEQDREAGT